MSNVHEKLAAALDALKTLQEGGTVAVRARDLSRTNRERLVAGGFLWEVMKGWYLPARPDVPRGESTAWYTSYWDFCASYLHERFDRNWCLSPEQSILLHVGQKRVPEQLIVRSPRGHNNTATFPHNTSLLDLKAEIPEEQSIMEKEGMRVYSVPDALLACPASFYKNRPVEARAALAMIPDASVLLPDLLDKGLSVVAGRLAGAMRNIGRDRIAAEILATMKAATYDVREQDPFFRVVDFLPTPSPHVNRLHLMWRKMRDEMPTFPFAPGLPEGVAAYLHGVDKAYVDDAYHSLSIEGYRVSPELIERVRSGNWNPESREDKNQRDTMAASGYWQAFCVVRESLEKILSGENPGRIVDQDHGGWYRSLFAPSVGAGILKPSDLAGYRNDQVFLRGSMYVPPGKEAARELMPAFFELLEQETDPGARAVLGHFFFVNIHPYMDGNGRMGRFVMNAMLASGGYPWTVIPVERRDDYMAALEEASINQNIAPFATLVAGLVKQQMKISG
ncbi:MAG: Fic family protein [Thermodesulfobacteriota bacterium]|nr:Fic family protein [Thermodesulfobacteriota bacterium]